ncbi:hypothetical protein J2R89_001695 [Bradyrhizobium elkanii]|nr:hypothetical protein [Bradyrhizobium elkanii]
MAIIIKARTGLVEKTGNCRSANLTTVQSYVLWLICAGPITLDDGAESHRVEWGPELPAQSVPAPAARGNTFIHHR